MCVRITMAAKLSSPNGSRLEWVGGPNGWGSDWLLSVDEVIELIESKNQRWQFFVEEPVGDRVEVRVKRIDGVPYLTTTPDSSPHTQNNLLSLPEPNFPVQRQPLANLAWWPEPQTPRIERFGLYKSSPTTGGYYATLPTTAVSFRMWAPWPGRLRFTVRRLIGGMTNLELEPPARQVTAPWVDCTPLDPGFEKRDQTLWWAQVALPPPTLGTWVPAESYEIDIRHESFNPACPGPRISPPLTLRLGPQVVGNPSVTVTHPGGASPNSGSLDVRFAPMNSSSPGYPTMFRANTRNLDIPQGAVIASVTNASKTAPIVDGALRERRALGGMRFGLTDDAGATRTTPGGLGPDEPTGLFNGLRVRGDWEAEYIGGSVAFLFEQPATGNPVLNPEIKARVAWMLP